MATSSKKSSETEQYKVVTTSAGGIRIVEPSGSSSRKKPKITVLVESEEAVKNQARGFVGFVRERAVVGLAVAFVVATQLQVVVKSITDDIINPAFTLLFGGQVLTDRKFTWHFHGRHESFAWGKVIYGLLDFIFVLIAIYAIIKIFKLDKLDKKKD